jgi:hypothetical protein
MGGEVFRWSAGVLVGFLSCWIALRWLLAWRARRRLSASRAVALVPSHMPLHLRQLLKDAYIAVLRRSYGLPMAKDTRLIDPRATDEEALAAMLAGRRLSSDVQRAYEDYLRLKSALGWLMDLEPDNEVAIAMVRGDTSRAEVRLVRLLRDM